jgi:hypothetical protein
MEQEKSQDFKVTDRRSSFREDTAESPASETTTPPQEEAPEQEPSAQGEATTPPREEAPRQESRDQSAETTTSPPFPEANLFTLIFSLYTHTQICLGILPDPMSQKPQKDLPQAKYNIDLLGVLKEKTAGNLTQEEEQTLENILYEVRMGYVEASK